MTWLSRECTWEATWVVTEGSRVQTHQDSWFVRLYYLCDLGGRLTSPSLLVIFCRIGVIHSTCFLGLLKGLSETVLPDLSCMLLLIVWVDAYFICVGHCLVAGVCRLQNRSLSSSCWLIRKIFLHITRASKTATSLLDLKESSQYLMWYALILPKQLLQRSTFRLQGCWSTQGLVSAIKTRMPLIFL